MASEHCIEIIVPWPLAKLSPNERGHWTTKEGARGQAKMIGRNAVNKLAYHPGFHEQPLKITLIVHPPDRRRYDWDNLVGRMKYVQDGICEALGVNDNQIKRASVIMSAKPLPGGAVYVRLEEAEGE